MRREQGLMRAGRARRDGEREKEMAERDRASVTATVRRERGWRSVEWSVCEAAGAWSLDGRRRKTVWVPARGRERRCRTCLERRREEKVSLEGWRSCQDPAPL